MAKSDPAAGPPDTAPAPREPAKKSDPKPPAEKRSPEVWRIELGVSEPEHAGTVVFAGWDPHAQVTRQTYKQKLAAWRRSPA